MRTVRDIAQPGLARLTGGQKVESSNLSIPTIFLPFLHTAPQNLSFAKTTIRRCKRGLPPSRFFARSRFSSAHALSG